MSGSVTEPSAGSVPQADIESANTIPGKGTHCFHRWDFYRLPSQTQRHQGRGDSCLLRDVVPDLALRRRQRLLAPLIILQEEGLIICNQPCTVRWSQVHAAYSFSQYP